MEEGATEMDAGARVAAEAGEAVGGIAAVAEQNSAATEEMSASAEEISARVEEVTADTHSPGEMADELRAPVAACRLGRSEEAAAEPVELRSAQERTLAETAAARSECR